MTYDSLGYEYRRPQGRAIIIGGTPRGWRKLLRSRYLAEARRAGVKVHIPKRPTEEQLERCRQAIAKGYYDRQQRELKQQAGL